VSSALLIGREAPRQRREMEGRPMSDKEQIFQELQGYIVEQLGVEKEKVTLTAAFIEDLNADSLDLVEFAMGLEEKFGVTIADEELTKIKTVEDAVNAIVEKKA
jgi:acyl carrier protein